MSVFDPESSHNRFWAVLEDLRDTETRTSSVSTSISRARRLS